MCVNMIRAHVSKGKKKRKRIEVNRKTQTDLILKKKKYMHSNRNYKCKHHQQNISRRRKNLWC